MMPPLRQLLLKYMPILGKFKDNLDAVLNQTCTSILNIIGQLSTYGFLCNFQDNSDTETTTANKSMGFDLSASQPCPNIIVSSKQKTIVTILIVVLNIKVEKVVLR